MEASDIFHNGFVDQGTPHEVMKVGFRAGSEQKSRCNGNSLMFLVRTPETSGGFDPMAV
jgi:hypothetical protein